VKRTALQVFLPMAVALLGVLSLWSLAERWSERREASRAYAAEQARLATIFVDGLDDPMWNLDPATARDMLDADAQTAGLRGAVLLDNQGSIYASRVRSASGVIADGKPEDPAQREWLASADIRNVRTVTHNGVTLGQAVFYASDDMALAAVSEGWRKSFARVLALWLCLSGVIWGVLQRSLDRPLNALTRWVRSLRPGEQPSPWPPDQSRELLELSETFTEWSVELAQQSEAFKELEGHYRALIGTSSEVTLLVDRDGKVLHFYGSPEAITGFRSEERVGQSLLAVVAPEDLEAAQAFFAEVLAAPDQTKTRSFNVVRKDGEIRWVQVTAINRLTDPVLRAVVVKYTDANEVREAQRQLIRLERLAAIGQTAAGLAHEIRNPLAAISVRAEFLKGQLTDRPALLADLDIVLDQVERLRGLVNQVLEGSRAGDLQLSMADAGELMESAFRAARLRYGPGADDVSVDRDILKPAPRLRLDVQRVQRVLLNLVLNAFQALGGHGSIVLGVRTEGAWAVLSVQDDGPGVPEASRARIFEPFFTTKQTGSGLGLWLCRSIVEQHGGRLEQENLSPRGCRFTLRLPLEAPEQTA
jgi:PAS domain S-box-containing protein